MAYRDYVFYHDLKIFFHKIRRQIAIYFKPVYGLYQKVYPPLSVAELARRVNCNKKKETKIKR